MPPGQLTQKIFPRAREATKNETSVSVTSRAGKNFMSRLTIRFLTERPLKHWNCTYRVVQFCLLNIQTNKKRTALCEKIRFYKKNTDNQYPRENEGSLQCNPDRLWAKLKVHFCCLCLFPSNVQQQRTTFCKIADLRNGLVHIGKPTTVHFKLQQQYTEMPTAHSLRMHG